MRKAKSLIQGFTVKEISTEANVALRTVYLYLERGGKTKGHKIEQAVERLKAKKLQTLRAEVARLESSLQTLNRNG